MHPIVSRCFRPNKWFGHSYTALREINRFTLSTGIIVGMLIGLIPIPLPGGLDFKLGLAGGPLIAKLILGDAGRAGPLIWYFPYNANLLLPQLGLILLFAGVGTKAGHAFFHTLMAGGTGLVIVGAGALVTCATAFPLAGSATRA